MKITASVMRRRIGLNLRPLPLKRVYLLSNGKHPGPCPLDKRRALIELLKHSYGAHPVMGKNAQSRHFSQCARLVNRIETRRLMRGNDLESLPSLADFVEEDMQERNP